MQRILGKEYQQNNDALFIKTAHHDERTAAEAKGQQMISAIRGDVVLAHARYGTCGENSVLNAHGWTVNGWRMVHNGFVSQLATYGQGKCDSAKMFDELAELLKTASDDKAVSEAILKVTGENDFSGRAILWNDEQNVGYMFGDFQVYRNREAVLISSCDITPALIEEKKTEAYRGLSLEYTEETLAGESIKMIELDGIFKITDMFNPEAFAFEFIAELDLAKYPTVYKKKYESKLGTGYYQGYKGMTQEQAEYEDYQSSFGIYPDEYEHGTHYHHGGARRISGFGSVQDAEARAEALKYNGYDDDEAIYQSELAHYIAIEVTAGSDLVRLVSTNMRAVNLYEFEAEEIPDRIADRLLRDHGIDLATISEKDWFALIGFGLKGQKTPSVTLLPVGKGESTMWAFNSKGKRKKIRRADDAKNEEYSKEDGHITLRSISGARLASEVIRILERVSIIDGGDVPRLYLMRTE
ncbi:unnamed protein product [Sphagnum balticum]